MLWLSLYLPHLALELFLRGRAGDGPLAVVEVSGTRQWVHARNRAAAAAGVHRGMPVSAALALCGGLQLCRRDLPAERAALEGIAAWAGQFTPRISLEPPAGLLLEIAGSLRLFGGLEPLHRRIDEGLAELGYRHRGAIAPTPQGAWWLARAGGGEVLHGQAALERRLAVLPLGLLNLPPERLTALRGMGLQRIGDCLRLPRDGLARRLGPELLVRLDRALGRSPDPRPPYTPPERFLRRLPLPAEVSDTQALLFAARRLVGELAGFLLGRGAGVQRLQLHLEHRGLPASRLDIGLAAPSRDRDHLNGLLREYLERFTLPAPVEAIGLGCEEPVALAQVNADLFDPRPERQPWMQLVERLRARLGDEAVTALALNPDHRPERAWRPAPPGVTAPGAGGTPARPLWLLEAPLPLRSVGGCPWLGGTLTRRAGPERIEGGWWDGGDVARDYYLMENPQHERFWVFRDRRGGETWYLQGIFA